MKTLKLIAILVLKIYYLFLYTSYSQEDTTLIRMLFVGDIMGHDGQIKAAYNENLKTYNYNDVFSYIEPYLKTVDIAAGNLEVTLGGAPYTGYPQFSSPDQLAEALKNAGFNLLFTANNHCLDRGKNGLTKTIKLLDSLKIMHTGTFYNQTHRDTSYPLIVDIKNMRIAFLNYTYGTNGILPQKPVIVNYIDTSIIAKDIEKTQKYNPDIIIAIMHWGNEYERSYNIEQKTLANFLFKKGVKLIIGSHPHVIQPVEIFYENNNKHIDKLVAYSLGNFVSNQRSRYKDGGIMYKVTLKKFDDKTIIYDCSYIPVWVFAGIINNDYEFRVVPYHLYKKNPNILPLTENDKIKIEQFYQDTKNLLKNIKEDEK